MITVKREARPYDFQTLNRSFETLPNGTLLKERDLQSKIDLVYPSIDFTDIEEHAVFKEDGRTTIERLKHRPKSYLFDLLEIDSVSCICEGDINSYSNLHFEDRLQLEIPVHFSYVLKMDQLKVGNKPFIIPDKAYDPDLGLHVKEILEKNFDVNRQLI
jgi:CRISPR-associated endonuclease/helicase Cas3